MDPDEIDDTSYEQLDGLDTLDPRAPVDPLDEGWSPVERPWAVTDYGTTAREQSGHEDLGHRLARELPESWALEDDGDGIGDTADTDGEPRDDEVGDARAGRLAWSDDSGDLFGSDVGIDGAAASAEEAAVHVVPDER